MTTELDQGNKRLTRSKAKLTPVKLKRMDGMWRPVPKEGKRRRQGGGCRHGAGVVDGGGTHVDGRGYEGYVVVSIHAW